MRDRLLKVATSADLLQLYRHIRQGSGSIVDEEQNPIYIALKLSGVVKSTEDGILQVRNRIYYDVFLI